MRPSPLQRRTPVPLALAAAITLALAAAGHAPLALAQGAANAAPIAIQIPALPLGQALNELARQARLQMTFAATPQLAARTAPAVSGTLTVRQALDRLLAGSGLIATMDGDAVVVRPAAPATAAETSLPAVTVTAAATASGSPLGYLSQSVTSGALGSKAVLDTPFSMTVVDSEEIVTRGARSLGQIFANDVAVYTPTTSATVDWWGTQIRGLPLHNYYIDDVPMALYWGGDFPAEVAENVTALKGLTGFMHGFGTPGGAISYQLKRPVKGNETTLSVGLRNPGQLSTHLDVSRELGGDLAIRANLAVDNGEAYNASKIDRKVASLAIEKRFNASLTGFVNLVHEDSRLKAEPPVFAIWDYDENSGGLLPPPTYDYDKLNVDNAYYKTKTQYASAGVNWQLDEQWQLKLQAGTSRKLHNANKTFAYLSNRWGDYEGYSYNFAGQDDSRFVQAMALGSISAGGVRHEIVTGVGLQRSQYRSGNAWYWTNDFSGNLYQEQTFLTTRTPDFSLGPVSSDSRQTYVFASDTVHLNDHWQVIAGVRHTHYRAKTFDDGTPDYSTRKATPTLALIHKPDAQTSLYGSYAEGLEPGSRVGAPYANAGELLGASVSRQYEVGAKRESGGVDYAAALFRIEKANNMDVQRGADRYLTQDGQQIYQGLEMSAAWQASRQLNLGVGLIHLDATIDKVSADSAALQGNVPSGVPKWQAVANAQYRVASLPGLKLHGNVRYAGGSYTSDANTMEVPGFTVVNAGFSYDFKLRGQAVTLIGNVYNLLDKKYWAGGGWGSVNLGEGRNVALTLRTRF